MQNPERLWLALERIPGLSAVQAEWQRWLGDDLAWVEQDLLRPTGELARVYPSHHGEPYQIVDHGGGRYKAVHPDGEPPTDLATPDITILRLNIVKLIGLLCPLFGFKTEPVMQTQSSGRFRIGTWPATARTTCPVWFCVQPDRSLLHDSLSHLAADADGPFVVLTPGPIGDAALARTLTDRIACHVPLSDAIESVDGVTLVVSPAGTQILESFRRSVRVFEAAAKFDGQDRSVASTLTVDERYEWARQVDLVRATNQVLGEGMLNKGVLSRACADGHVEANGGTGRAARVRVRSFLTWMSQKYGVAKDEETQVRNAVIGEISSRNS